MATIHSLPFEVHALICTFLSPVTLSIARCAWAGFARIAPFTALPVSPKVALLARTELNTALKHPAVVAAMSGDVAALDLMRRIEFSLPPFICEYAALGGSIEAMRWLHDVAGLSFSTDNAIAAVSRGHLECLIYICDRTQVDMTRVFDAAVYRGYVNCADYAYRSGDALYEFYMHHWIDTHDGGLEIIKFLYSIGVDIDKNSVLHFCSDECFRYICSLGLAINEDDFDWCMHRKRKRCHLSKLKIYVAAGYTLTYRTLIATLQVDCIDCYMWLNARLGAQHNVERIIEYNAFRCLRHLHTSGLLPQIDSRYIQLSISAHGIKILKFLHSIGLRDERACWYAGHSGNFLIMKWLVKHGGYKFDWHHAPISGEDNAMWMIKWLKRRGGDWAAGAPEACAKYGNGRCLHYLHRHGIDIDFATCAFVAAENHKECIRGYEYRSSECYISLGYKSHQSVIEWINKTSGQQYQLPTVHDI